jgi:NADH dehydrogenase
VHISAIRANEDSPSSYERSKAAGENAVLPEFPNSVILRPSLILDRRIAYATASPPCARVTCCPVIGGGKSTSQPVYAGDVAAAIATACGG